MMPRCLIACVTFMLLNLTANLRSETFSLGPDQKWFEVLSGNTLMPGDVVELSAGQYQDKRRLSIRHQGTAKQPITIQAREGAQVVFQRPDAKQNTLNMDGASHLHLIGIQISGGAAAIRISRTPQSNNEVVGIQIRDCHLHHLGGVAITCNEPGTVYRDCVFSRNHIHHTSGHGEAFYLGGNNASAAFHNGRIEHNYIHHLNGPSVSQGDGIEIKDGSSGNRVVSNVIHDTNYPGITVYGSGDGPVNRIERNLIWNTGDHGIQAAADAVIRGNTIVRTAHAGIYSRNHQSAICGNLRILNNVVVQNNDAAIRINNEPTPNQPAGIEIYNNQLHPIRGNSIRIQHLAGLRVHDNRGQGAMIPSDADPSWRITDQIDWSLPEDANHPAWQFINRQSLRELLFTRDDR